MKKLAGFMMCAASAVLLSTLMPAQVSRDFLTSDEVAQVRLTQEPNARLKLYTEFARLRIDQIKQLLSKEKPGRSVFIHDLLDEYVKVIETIDVVTDDALKKTTALELGVKAVADAEEEMLAYLKKVEESEPSDLARYRFSLMTAIDTTEDSLESAREDLGSRKLNISAREQKEKKAREAELTPSELENERASQKKSEEDQQKQKKAPTLRRKGEVAPEKN